MKNRVSKIVISMLITSFIMPEMVSARINGRSRRRSGTNGSERPLGLGVAGSLIINEKGNENKKDDGSITKEEYDLPENKVKYLNSLRLNVFQAKDKAIKQCEGISDAVSKIFSLSTTSSIMSAAGTGMAATGLVTGLMKKNKQDVANALIDNGLGGSEIKAGVANGVKFEDLNLTKEEKEKLEKLKVDYNTEKERHDTNLKAHDEHQEFINALITKNEGLQRMIDVIDDENDERVINSKKEMKENEVKKVWHKNKKEEYYQLLVKYAPSFVNAEKALTVYQEELFKKYADKAPVVAGDKQGTGNDLIDKNLKTAKTLGHIRTGMMAGASATSLISMGTSIGASVDSGKLSEKMTACNNAINELRTASNKLNAEIKDAQYLLKEKLGDNYEEKKPEYMKQAEKIHKISLDMIAGCKKYETKDISYVKNLMTASSVVSGIGTATAITGAITSGLANTKKAKGDRKYEKNMDLTANIMAGVTAGTSLTSTGLSGAASVATGKKLQQQAKDCEAALNNDLFVDLSKEVDAITKKQAEIEEERNKKIENMR